MRRKKTAKKSIKSFTLSPATLENIDSLARITGLDNSQIVDGCIQSTWAVVISGGFRQVPSIIEALSLTGSAGASFYVQGRKVDEHER